MEMHVEMTYVVVKYSVAVIVCVVEEEFVGGAGDVWKSGGDVISSKYLSGSAAANPDCDPLWFLARTEQ